MIFYSETIHLVINEIDDDTCIELRNVITECLIDGQNFLPIIINSYGGYCHSTVEIIETIKVCPLKVITIATGGVYSAALPIFASGTKGMRYVTPNTIFLGHESRNTVDSKEIMTRDSYEKMELSLRLSDNTNYKYLSEFTDISEGDWRRKLSKTDYYFTPEQAIDFGVADILEVPIFGQVEEIKNIVSGVIL